MRLIDGLAMHKDVENIRTAAVSSDLTEELGTVNEPSSLNEVEPGLNQRSTRVIHTPRWTEDYELGNSI